MKNLIKRALGIDKLEQAKEAARLAAEEALKIAEDAKREAELALMTPKQRATAKGEPYVAVLETHVNKENLRNGFFELDWNEQFVLQLKQEGYGFDGDPEEEIVDRWFRTLCGDIAKDEGIDMTDRTGGFINVKKLAEGKSEVS